MKFLVTLFVLSLVCGVAQAQSRRDSINVLGYVSGLAVSFQETNSYLGFGIPSTNPFEYNASNPCQYAPDNTIKIVPGSGSFEANPYLIVCQGGSADSLNVAKPDYVIAGTCPDDYHAGTVFDAANFFRSDGANANIEVTVTGVPDFACRGTTPYRSQSPLNVNIGLTPSGYGSELYGLTFTTGTDGNLCVSDTAPIQFFATNIQCTSSVNYNVGDYCNGLGLAAATTQDVASHFTAGFIAEDAIRYLILRQDILKKEASNQYNSCGSSGFDYTSYNYPVQFIQTATSCPFDVNIPIVSSNSATSINIDSTFVLAGLTGNKTTYSYSSYGCTSQVSAFNNQPVWTASRLTLLEKGPDFNSANANAFTDNNAFFYSSPVLACKFRADLNYLPVNPPSCSTQAPANNFYCVSKDTSYCPCDATYCGSTCGNCCFDFCPTCCP